MYMLQKCSEHRLWSNCVRARRRHSDCVSPKISSRESVQLFGHKKHVGWTKIVGSQREIDAINAAQLWVNAKQRLSVVWQTGAEWHRLHQREGWWKVRCEVEDEVWRWESSESKKIGESHLYGLSEYARIGFGCPQVQGKHCGCWFAQRYRWMVRSVWTCGRAS